MAVVSDDVLSHVEPNGDETALAVRHNDQGGAILNVLASDTRGKPSTIAQLIEAGGENADIVVINGQVTNLANKGWTVTNNGDGILYPFSINFAP